MTDTAIRLSKIDDDLNKECLIIVNGNEARAAEECLSINAPSAEADKITKIERNWEYYLRYVSLAVLVVQNTSQVLLMRYATRREQPQFLKTVAVFFNEVLKLIASIILFVISSGSVLKALQDFKHHFIIDFVGTLKVCVPALIYTIQNFLLYIAIEHLDAATYMVTYQLKILTTALFTVLMLKRRLSVIQWLSLCVLIGGVVLVQINAGKGVDKNSNKLINMTTLTTTTVPSITTTSPINNSPANQKPWIGLLAVLTACIMSGFAGIYFEKILKDSNVSIWLRNIQLAVLSLPISLIIVAIKDNQRVLNEGFLQGFDVIVWCVVAIQAFGGLVVAIVIKYADNILKAFATSIAIVVSSIASIFIFSVMPKPLFMAGAALVIGAVVLYSIFPYKMLPANVIIANELEANKDALKLSNKESLDNKPIDQTLPPNNKDADLKSDGTKLN